MSIFKEIKLDFFSAFSKTMSTSVDGQQPQVSDKRSGFQLEKAESFALLNLPDCIRFTAVTTSLLLQAGFFSGFTSLY